jgi:hypothetical protein
MMSYVPSRYIAGFVVALMASILGMWMVYRALIGDTTFIEGIRIPIWLAFCLGVLMQSLLTIYIFLGLKAGFFG